MVAVMDTVIPEKSVSLSSPQTIEDLTNTKPEDMRGISKDGHDHDAEATKITYMIIMK
jgi:hypothetical protein